MTDLALTVIVSDSGILTFDSSGAVSPELLEQAVRAAADDALVGRDLRRLEVSVPTEDLAARRAVLRAGFRLEGFGARRSSGPTVRTATSGCSHASHPTRPTARTVSQGDEFGAAEEAADRACAVS